MIIERRSAQLFIDTYKAVLEEVHHLAELGPQADIIMKLANARYHMTNHPEYLRLAVDSLQNKNIGINRNIVEAISKIQIITWVYLKDTTLGSIFIDSNKPMAYVVKGLLEPLSSVVGKQGFAIETGVMPYCGSWVCDGIISNPVMLGKNIKHDFAEFLKELRSNGLYSKSPAP